MKIALFFFIFFFKTKNLKTITTKIYFGFIIFKIFKLKSLKIIFINLKGGTDFIIYKLLKLYHNFTKLNQITGKKKI